MEYEDERLTSLVYADVQKDSSYIEPSTDLDLFNPFLVEDILLTDYVMFRIGRIGYPDIRLFPDLVGRFTQHPLMVEIMQKLQSKADEFEGQHYAKFENRKSLLEKIPERAFLDFIDTLHGIFEDNDINWGRIIGFFSFTGSYCCSCINCGMVRIVRSLVEYAVKYMDANLSVWVLSNGGWRGLLTALETETFILKLK